MLKTGTEARTFTKDEVIKLKNVTSLSISNQGETEIVVNLDNVPETLPKYDTDNGFAPSFDIPGDGSYSDFDITLKFTGGTGKAILRYRSVLNPLQTPNCN